MGQSASKTSEIRKSQSTDTPRKLSKDDVTSDNIHTPETKKFVDPRSPYICRTPLESLATPQPSIAITKQLNLTTDEQNLMTPTRLDGAQKNFLQQKLLKNLGFQSFDPRSPTQFINRTPIKLDSLGSAADESIECSPIDQSVEAIEEPDTSLVLTDPATDVPAANETVTIDEAETSIDKFIAELEIDPRSPSINVERTPIVFKESEPVDRDEVVELETILDHPDHFTTPTKMNIYQDDEPEAITPIQIDGTANSPKLANNRTPLSCLGNNKSRQGVPRPTGKLPKHPILFIGQHQNHSTPKNRIVPFGNANSSASKIPVFKSSIF